MIKMIKKSTPEFAENLAKLEETLFTTAWDRETINDKINRGEFLYWVYEQMINCWIFSIFKKL